MVPRPWRSAKGWTRCWSTAPTCWVSRVESVAITINTFVTPPLTNRQTQTSTKQLNHSVNFPCFSACQLLWTATCTPPRFCEATRRSYDVVDIQQHALDAQLHPQATPITSLTSLQKVTTIAADDATINSSRRHISAQICVKIEKEVGHTLK